MIDKVVLLTIFLYITLNLRKIEKFIQSGYKFEAFTDFNTNDRDRSAVTKLTIITNLKTQSAVGMAKLAIAFVMIALKMYELYNRSELMTVKWFRELILWLICIGMFIANSVLLGKTEKDDDIKNLSYLQSFSNILGDFIIIYYLLQRFFVPSKDLAHNAKLIHEIMVKSKSEKKTENDGGVENGKVKTEITTEVREEQPTVNNDGGEAVETEQGQSTDKNKAKDREGTSTGSNAEKSEGPPTESTDVDGQETPSSTGNDGLVDPPVEEQQVDQRGNVLP